MINNDQYDVGSIVKMKKAHPCEGKSKLFEVIRIGMDIKLKCLSCGNIISLPRFEFNQKVKEIIEK